MCLTSPSLSVPARPSGPSPATTMPHASDAAVAVTGVDEPADAAHALLDQARRGGAGDNVGVAVSAAW